MSIKQQLKYIYRDIVIDDINPLHREEEFIKALNEATRSVLMNQKDSIAGHCLLHYFMRESWACSHSNYVQDMIKLLLDLDRSLLYEKDEYGYTPLHVAFSCFGINILTDVVQLLLDYDTEKKIVLEETPRGMIPLHFACEMPLKYNTLQNKRIRLLLQHDIEKKSILKKNYWHDTPLHFACQSNAPFDTIQLLLEYDIEKKTIFCKNSSNFLPIHFACQRNTQIEVIQLLLKHDVKKKTLFEYCGQWHYLPIHYSFTSNAPNEVIRFLLYHQSNSKIYNIPLKHSKINNFLNVLMAEINNKFADINNNYERKPTLTNIHNNYERKLTLANDSVKKVEKFISYSNLSESTTLLELAMQKSKSLYGIEVVMSRTLDFLMENSDRF